MVQVQRKCLFVPEKCAYLCMCIMWFLCIYSINSNFFFLKEDSVGAR